MLKFIKKLKTGNAEILIHQILSPWTIVIEFLFQIMAFFCKVSNFNQSSMKIFFDYLRCKILITTKEFKKTFLFIFNCRKKTRS